MVFSKELMLTAITSLSDLDTMKYIAQHSFVLTLSIMWLLNWLIFFLIAELPKRASRTTYWIAFVSVQILSILFILGISFGILPILLTLN